ncbi:MAG: DUF3298 domain-containing protein [Clostridia bacterium]|nr:DUF3298 domain-containing protein [Clostridia bacterium]
MNEEEPVVVGNSGSLYTGDIPVVAEQDALINITEEDMDSMFDVKTQYLYDNSNEKIKSDLSIPFLYIDGKEQTEFNKNLEEKYTKTFESFKETMQDVEHSFTYKVYYVVFSNVVKNEPVVSIIVTEKMVDDETKAESLKKRSAYNINIKTKEVLEQRDVVISLLGSSYKEAIKESVIAYLEENGMAKRDEYKYAYTGFENFYIKKGKLHLIFSPGEIADKSYGILEVELNRLENFTKVETNASENTESTENTENIEENEN